MASLETALSALLAEKKYATARDILITMNGADIESVFEELPEESLPLLFRLLPKELAAEVFVEMDPEEQEMLIKGFSDSELKEVVDDPGKPILCNLNAGHAAPRCIVPFGVEAHVNAEQQIIRFEA